MSSRIIHTPSHQVSYIRVSAGQFYCSRSLSIRITAVVPSNPPNTKHIEFGTNPSSFWSLDPSHQNICEVPRYRGRVCCVHHGSRVLVVPLYFPFKHFYWLPTLTSLPPTPHLVFHGVRAGARPFLSCSAQHPAALAFITHSRTDKFLGLCFLSAKGCLLGTLYSTSLFTPSRPPDYASNLTTCLDQGIHRLLLSWVQSSSPSSLSNLIIFFSLLMFSFLQSKTLHPISFHTLTRLLGDLTLDNQPKTVSRNTLVF